MKSFTFFRLLDLLLMLVAICVFGSLASELELLVNGHRMDAHSLQMLEECNLRCLVCTLRQMMIQSNFIGFVERSISYLWKFRCREEVTKLRSALLNQSVLNGGENAQYVNTPSCQVSVKGANLKKVNISGWQVGKQILWIEEL